MMRNGSREMHQRNSLSRKGKCMKYTGRQDYVFYVILQDTPLLSIIPLLQQVLIGEKMDVLAHEFMWIL